MLDNLKKIWPIVVLVGSLCVQWGAVHAKLSTVHDNQVSAKEQFKEVIKSVGKNRTGMASLNASVKALTKSLDELHKDLREVRKAKSAKR